MTHSTNNDLRLIEAGFPCHQVGAETQRERDTGKAPPTHRLHVWWARRPLTPSRAAILASLLPADTNPDWFLRQLGIEKRVVTINGQVWTLTGKVLDKVEKEADGAEVLWVDDKVLQLIQKENERRAKNRELIRELIDGDASLGNDPVVRRWQTESKPISGNLPRHGQYVTVTRIPADPAHVNERILFAKSEKVVSILGAPIKWDTEDLYGYTRAFTKQPVPEREAKVVLDPTAGGGSIPFEALRLGHNVIANELNPVATVILHATIDYPAKFGPELSHHIISWGEKLLEHVSRELKDITPFSPLPPLEKEHLKNHCRNCPDMIPHFDVPEWDQTGILYCRQVTCPQCGGEVPLLNTCWLSKEAGKQWGVRIVTDGKERN
ncbi:MAG: DUF1156 domain-containing protein, partial [Desulfobacteraceae bacterium]